MTYIPRRKRQPPIVTFCVIKRTGRAYVPPRIPSSNEGEQRRLIVRHYDGLGRFVCGEEWFRLGEQEEEQ